jgi:O-antigen/teichoic acid export membrane protein
VLRIARCAGLEKIRLTASSALALSTVGTNALRVISTIVLTRLLSPDVYGITGMIMSIFYMVHMMTDIGLQAYVIRHERSDEPHFLDSVFTIHAIRGVILAGLAALLAWPLSKLLIMPGLAAPLSVSSLVFAIDGLISLHQFRGLRDGKVQRFAMIELLTGVSQTLVALGLALLLRNVWAIVASMVVASSIRAWATHFFFAGGRHSFRFDGRVAGDLWRFSRVIATSSIITLVIVQVDKLALGRSLSLIQFGTYVVASSLAAAPAAFAFNYASSIVYPAVAAAWRMGNSLSDAYYRCWGRFFYLYAFGGGILIGIAELLVRVLYDPRYGPAAHYLKILAVSTAIMMVTRSMETVEVAMGRTRIAIELNLTRLIWVVGGSIVAIQRMEPLIFVLTVGVLEVPAYIYAAWRLTRIGVIRWVRELSLLLALIAGLALGEFASLARRVLFPYL